MYDISQGPTCCGLQTHVSFNFFAQINSHKVQLSIFARREKNFQLLPCFFSIMTSQVRKSTITPHKNTLMSIYLTASSHKFTNLCILTNIFSFGSIGVMYDVIAPLNPLEWIPKGSKIDPKFKNDHFPGFFQNFKNMCFVLHFYTKMPDSGVFGPEMTIQGPKTCVQRLNEE